MLGNMVRYHRNFVAGATYFFTANAFDRNSNVLTQHIGLLPDAFRTVRHVHPFAIDAVVVLPDHLHIIMTLPESDQGYARRWMLIKRRFTESLLRSRQDVPRHANGEYALWQRRYWEHTIRDERDYERHVDYIHFNPIKHGLVSRVRDWSYSSFQRYVRQGLLPEDWAGDVSIVEGGKFGEA